MKIAAYVLSIDGKPLMPMYSFRRVKRFLKEEKAIVVSMKPFQIQLTYAIEDPVINDEHLGVDTGRTNLGLAIIENDGKLMYSAHVETANKTVSKHMKERAFHRHVSRSGERKVRQRRAIKSKTVFEDGKSQYRMLPKCEEPIVTNFITNSESRFANRKREEGWLTPTAWHLLHTTLKTIDMACEVLPVKDITIEITKWDFAKMENPDIENWEYQKGVLFGFKSVDDAVCERQHGKCLMCKKPIQHYHHIVPRHLGGSDTLNNKVGLCARCHGKVHTDKEFFEKLKTKQQGMLKKYGALSVLNQIMPYLLKEVIARHPDKNVYVTTGYETAALRANLGIEKTHDTDAWCIAATRINTDDIIGETLMDVRQSKPFEIKQFRRQNRANINNQRERTYKYNWKTVAKNRRARFEQEGDSLETWYKKQVEKYGKQVADKMRSQLTVIKSERRYNNKNRVMPGAVFLYDGKRYVLSGQHTNGMYYRAVGCDSTNFPAKKCAILMKNTGLVYI